MSAVEFIEGFKAMPPEEQAEVRKFLLQFADSESRQNPSFVEAADHVFEEYAPLLKKLAE
jgi:hypothetical protein